MTQTKERERTVLTIDSFVAVAQRVPGQEEIADMAEAWMNDPAERIASQLEELALLYDGRTDRTAFYDFNGRNHQYDTFATRDAAGDQLEEIYTVHSSYSSQHGQYRHYAVTVLDGTQTAYRITVANGEFDVQVGGQAVYNPDERDAIVTDFLYRSLIATFRTTERTPEERELADLDALIKLEQCTYDGRRKVVTATE